LGGNEQYKGATLCLEEKNSRKRDGNFLQPDRGHLVYKRQLDPFSK